MFNGKTIHTLHFTTIDSTNSWAKHHAHEFDHQALTCITADEQTAGRGQRDKTWFSPPLGNLYTTFFFVLPKDFRWSTNLGQILALSIAHVLEKLSFAPTLKWPNDVLIDEKKAGGILCETFLMPEGLGVVLGLGLNVHIAPEYLTDLDQPATSLAAYSNKALSLPNLAHDLIEQFLIDLKQLRQIGFSTFVQEYNRLLAFKNEKVLFTHSEGTFSAICHSIDEEGRLILECADGQHQFCSGSLRKIKQT